MWLELLLKILAIVPVIASGIQQIHAEKDVDTKTQMAQDALNLAVAGATAVLPAQQAALASSASQIASATLSATVAALHTAALPVVPAAPVNTEIAAA